MLAIPGCCVLKEWHYIPYPFFKPNYPSLQIAIDFMTSRFGLGREFVDFLMQGVMHV